MQSLCKIPTSLKNLIYIYIGIIIEQISVKSNHNIAFYDEEIKFGTVMKGATKSKLAIGPNIYRS